MKPFEIALQEYGIKAVSGVLHSAEVLKYFKNTGSSWVTDDETAWCAAFVNWCLMRASARYSNKLNARSFLTYGNVTKVPALGDIVVLWRITKEGPYGHVGFYVRETKDIIYILGGNQSNQVNIAPFSKTQLLSYRKIIM